MKDSNREVKLLKKFFQGIAIIVIVTGIFFSFLIAKLNDAPGFALFGSVAVLGIASLLYGLGEVIILLKKNNILLSDINDKLDK